MAKGSEKIRVGNFTKVTWQLMEVVGLLFLRRGSTSFKMHISFMVFLHTSLLWFYIKIAKIIERNPTDGLDEKSMPDKIKKIQKYSTFWRMVEQRKVAMTTPIGDFQVVVNENPKSSWDLSVKMRITNYKSR